MIEALFGELQASVKIINCPALYFSAPPTLWQKMNPSPPPRLEHNPDDSHSETEDWENAGDLDDDFDDCLDPNAPFDNPEWDGCVLMAETASVSLVPEDVLSKILHSTTLTVSGQSYQFRKLSMKFVPFQLRATQTTSETTHVIINDIVRLKMVHWYHPLYQRI